MSCRHGPLPLHSSPARHMATSPFFRETDVHRDSVSLPEVSVQMAELGLSLAPYSGPDKAMITGMTRQPRASCTWAWRIGGRRKHSRPRASPGLLAKEVLPRQVQAQPARGQGGGPCGQALDKVTLGQGWAPRASSHPPRLQRGASEANVPHSFP